jgi:hypothetical protein
MKEFFIGQIVVTKKEDWKIPNLPQVGKIVDIAYEYDYTTIISTRFDSSEVRVLPVVHFLGDNTPRPVAPFQIEQYKFKT